MQKERLLSLRWGDAAVASLALLIAVAIFAAGAMQAREKGRVAEIIVDGEILRTYDLDAVSEPFEVTLENGGFHMTALIEPGRIRMVRSDCPDQVCVRTGWLSTPGQASACVPARIMLCVTGGSQEMDVVLR